MKERLARIDRYWFAPSERFDLGVFRALFGLWLLYTWFDRVRPRLVQSLHRPIEFALSPSLIRWLHLPEPVPESVLSLGTWLFPALALCLALGLFVRPVLLVITPLYLYFEGSLSAWGYTSHSTILPALELVILCFAPGTGGFSLDELLRRRAQPKRGEPAGESARGVPSVWPIRLALLLTALLYLASGLSKLRYAGFSWLDGETLAFYMSGGSLRAVGGVQSFIADPGLDQAARFRDGFGLVDFAWVASPVALARELANVHWLMVGLSCAVVGIELTFPLSLLGRRLMLIYLALGAAFHLGVQALLRIDFGSYVLAYALFLDLGAARRFLLARLRALSRAYAAKS